MNTTKATEPLRTSNRWLDSVYRFLSSFGRGLNWAVFSNIVYYASQWGIVMALAKLGTPADVGAYALGLSVSAPVLNFTSCQARNLVASDVTNEFTLSDYVTFRAVSLVAAFIIIIASLSVGRLTTQSACVILLIAAAQALDSASETYFGFLQRFDRLDQVSLSLSVKGPLCLLLLSVTIWITRSVLFAVAALALGRAVILICFDIPNAIRVGGAHAFSWNRSTQSRLLITAFPLGLIAGVAALNMNVPRYFIESNLEKRELGIFSALASLIGVGNLLTAAIASCVIVSLANAWAKRDWPTYRALSVRFSIVSATLGALGIAVALAGGDKLLILLFRRSYAGNAGLLVWIMAAGAVGYLVSALGYTMTAARKLAQQLPPLVGSTIITAICCWFLVPRLGLIGAAQSWLIGSAFLLVWNAVLLWSMSSEPTATTDRTIQSHSTPLELN